LKVLDVLRDATSFRKKLNIIYFYYKLKMTSWVTQTVTGEFQRKVSQFRNFIQADPNAEFPAESGRYHLYVSYACPWAHRTLIMRTWKVLTLNNIFFMFFQGLEDAISYDVVHPFLDQQGWSFDVDESQESTGDRVNGFKRLRFAFP
jgi:putative glutathione S-transferase